MFRKLVPALLAPLLVVAACATEAERDSLRVDTGAGALAAVRGAPATAAEVGTGRFEMVMEIRSPQGPGDVLELRASGAFDNDRQQTAMEIDLGGMLEGLGEMLPEGFDEPTTVVVDGATAYVRSPMLEVLSGTSGWLSVPPEERGQEAGSLFGAGGSDPSQMLEVLRGVSDDVEVAGREEIRGVPATRYTATIDLAHALEEVPVDQRPRLQAQLDTMTEGLGNVPVEVWVDDDGLARRLRIGLDQPSGAAGESIAGSMTIDFFDYGQPVDIEVPSPDEVTPFTEVMGGLAGALAEAGA